MCSGGVAERAPLVTGGYHSSARLGQLSGRLSGGALVPVPAQPSARTLDVEYHQAATAVGRAVCNARDRDPGRRIPRGDRGGPEPVTDGASVVQSFFPPVAVTNQGAEIRTLYEIVFVIAAASSSSSKASSCGRSCATDGRPATTSCRRKRTANALAEALWTIIPSIIVAFLFVISWQTLNTVDAISAEPQMRARALAAQFQWQFDYYDESGENIVYTQLIPAGEGGGMALPVGKNIELVLESRDVIHAFYVPQFLFKRDVNPGMVNQFQFTIKPEDAGKTFNGQCAELCGRAIA
jgi:hypothetical protein